MQHENPFSPWRVQHAVFRDWLFLRKAVTTVLPSFSSRLVKPRFPPELVSGDPLAGCVFPVICELDFVGCRGASTGLNTAPTRSCKVH